MEKILKNTPPILIIYGFISSLASILATYVNQNMSTVGMNTVDQYIILIDNYLFAADQFFYYTAFAGVIWAGSKLYSELKKR
ncbi:hypothetical protein MXMO3_02682 [Maritalea myrionectae]|uniref:Uncharacterized protein n=1 Tax=Maritalea myrionectae TaxID=454601 RepID=A0A2R4MGV8_9HYPH|nr:hypothetical protein MXMO3_02682 [Maritalea myrionectae]